MLQQRQIVVKGLGKQIDIKDPAYAKYAGKSFQFIAWMLRFDIVTIYRTIALPDSYEISHHIMTTKIRSCI
jgi:hypothetical protein